MLLLTPQFTEFVRSTEPLTHQIQANRFASPVMPTHSIAPEATSVSSILLNAQLGKRGGSFSKHAPKHATVMYHVHLQGKSAKQDVQLPCSKATPKYQVFVYDTETTGISAFQHTSAAFC